MEQALVPSGEKDSPPSAPSDISGRRLRLLRLTAFILLPVTFVGFVAFTLFRTAAPGSLIGKRAPDFRLPVLGADRYLGSRDLQGQPVVLNFWASWCVPCREEAPTLEAAWRKYSQQGVRFVGVNVQDSEADAQAFVKEFGITFPSVRDTDLKLWTKLGVSGLPETFFIDHSWTFVGIGSGKQLDRQGSTKILGAIPPPLLNSQIEILLARKKGDL